MPSLRPIHTPLRQQWRVARYHLFPLLVFGGAIVLAVWLLGRYSEQSGSVAGIARGRVSQVSATYAGRIRSIPVRLSERVSKGQVVALMDDKLLVAQISTISGEIDRLRAEYEKERSILQSDVANRHSEWVAENRVFAGDVAQLKIKMMELKTVLEEDRALLKGLAVEMAETSRLVSAKVLPAVELERVRAAHEALAAKIRVNEGDLLKLLAAERKAAQDRTRDYARHTPLLPSEEIDLEHLHKAIQVQKGLIQELEAQRSETILRAPFDGIVIEVQPRAGDAVLRRPGEGVMRRVGEVVAPGEPILAIAETSPSEIIAYAGERQMKALSTGAVMEIRTRTHPVRMGWSRAVAVTPTIERLPERLWANPQLPTWGRPFLVSIPRELKLTPGELVWVRQR